MITVVCAHEILLWIYINEVNSVLQSELTRERLPLTETYKRPDRGAVESRGPNGHGKRRAAEVRGLGENAHRQQNGTYDKLPPACSLPQI